MVDLLTILEYNINVGWLKGVSHKKRKDTKMKMSVKIEMNDKDLNIQTLLIIIAVLSITNAQVR